MTDPRVTENKPQEPIELLPLPDPDRGSIRVNREDVSLGHSDEQMQAYARANLRAALEKERARTQVLFADLIGGDDRRDAEAYRAIKPQSDVAEQLARRFHNTYERLAPSFGYETRADTKQFDPQSANGKLMIAVCAEIAHPPITQSVALASEPVAWRRVKELGTNHDAPLFVDGATDPSQQYGCRYKPLAYAHPPAAPVASKSVALTHAQIEEVRQHLLKRNYPASKDDFHEYARLLFACQAAIAPVTSKSVEDCMREADDFALCYALKSEMNTVNRDYKYKQSRAALQAAIVAYGDAQWNAAIEAAEDVIANTVQGVEMAPAVRAVRRLKR